MVEKHEILCTWTLDPKILMIHFPDDLQAAIP